MVWFTFSTSVTCAIRAVTAPGLIIRSAGTTLALLGSLGMARAAECQETDWKRHVNKLTVLIYDDAGSSLAQARRAELETSADHEVVMVPIDKKELGEGDYNGRLATALQPYVTEKVEVFEFGHSGPNRAYRKTRTVVDTALKALDGNPGSVTYTDYGCNTGATPYRNPDNLDFCPGHNGVALAAFHTSAELREGQQVIIGANQFFMWGFPAPKPFKSTAIVDKLRRSVSRGFEVVVTPGSVDARPLGNYPIPEDLQAKPYDDNKQHYNYGQAGSY